MSVLTITVNPAIDISTNLDHVAPEIKLRCERPGYDPGGGGINVSRVLSRLGVDTTAIFPIGGETGGYLEKLVRDEGISTVTIPYDGRTRQNFSAGERSSGNQYRFGMPGEPLADDVWQQILDRITTLKKKPEYIVGSGSLPPGVPDDFYNMLADIGKDIGAKVIIDTSGKPLKRAVESGVFLLKPNIRELRDLTGREIENEDEQESTAQELLKSGKCEAIVLSLGAAGVLFVTKSGHERLRAPSVSIKSKIGAGDSTVAGIIYGLIKENDLAKAVRMGIAAGAAAVMTPGSQLACKDDILRLYELIIKKRI